MGSGVEKEREEGIYCEKINIVVFTEYSLYVPFVKNLGRVCGEQMS